MLAICSLNMKAKTTPKQPRDEVERFLREQLALGTCPVETIYEEAKPAGISTRT